jgi:hypothetical protein
LRPTLPECNVSHGGYLPGVGLRAIGDAVEGVPVVAFEADALDDLEAVVPPFRPMPAITITII